MPNKLEYAKIFQSALDKQIVQEATTGWMELNSKLVKYNGGDEVKMPSMVMDGLADYSRDTGFVKGSITLKWDTYKLTQDRGRTFTLDAMDVDETNFVATAGTVLGEFQRTQVTPEIDAFRYSKLATLAKTASQSRDLAISTATNVADEILADLANLEDVAGAQEVVISISPTLAARLGKDGKDYISKVAFKKGEIVTRVNSFDDNPIVRVRSRLLKTAFTFKDGTTSGQEAGGFEVAAGAQNINWIIAVRTAPIAVSKTDKVRIFDPNVNQDADAWKIDYRKYHDLWVPANKIKGVIANLAPAT